MFKRTLAWPHAGKPRDKQLEEINNEIFLYSVIIINDDGDLEKTKKTLESVYKQKLLPKFICVINPHGVEKHINELIDIFKSHDIPWKLENISNP